MIILYQYIQDDNCLLPHIYCIPINSVTLSYLNFCMLELNVYSPLFILIIALLTAQAR